ncbi:alpha-glucosidase [Talaromyces proteolyticus]|uniref:amidase n=1 Tax=Talaromyces proteolyticus TaxID=1131652 RepID=A0AAD4KWZ8_9EURO|nr:alpha-glucosidase [Talaromyces proteolyticus]KAH8698737.1 alpha-glucosidase [Talaromyces proteolyticus]
MTVEWVAPASSPAVNGQRQKNWESLVAAKREELQKSIPNAWRLTGKQLKLFSQKGINLVAADVCRKSGILSESELDITENYTAQELLQKLAAGEVSALETTTGFCKRASIAQQLLSCLTETFFPKALERANFLDDYLRREGRVYGPLHGLPVSVKDSFDIEGVLSTVGYVSFLEHSPATSNSAMINMLLDLGAVLYVKTNIPQTMMTGDSENNIFGRTLNPRDTNLTAGGSSGGEGALVAFRGSILGVGTDIAGSIRIPALCCGVYGFKPTTNRIPFGGQTSGVTTGFPGLIPSAGPLSHNLKDIQMFMSTILDAHPWKYDETAIGAPWHRLEIQKETHKLIIGILPEDPAFPLHPPIRRTLENAITSLRNHGHTIVHLLSDENRSVAYGNRLAFQYLTYGPHVDHIATSGEPLVTSVAKFSNPMFTGPFPVAQDLSLEKKIVALHEARQNYAKTWRKTWLENKLHVILAPGSQNTAVPHDTYGWPPYTVMWNLLDFPACIIPFGIASKHLDPEPMKVQDNVQPSYDPHAVHGLPCALQVIAPKFQDEQCLLAAEIIDKDIRNN